MTSPRTALDNVRVFDGSTLSDPTTVVIDGAVIGTDDTGAEHLDAGGAILLPGLIDSHVHLADTESPGKFTAFGVTTALDMACDPDIVAGLRNAVGTTDIRSAGLAIVGPGGMHATFLPEPAIIRGHDQAEPMVAQRRSTGSDYIKLMLEAPGEGGPDAATAKTVAAEAHARGLRVIAHAATVGAYAMAVDAGVDVITHIPVEAALPQHDIDRIAAEGRVVVPTLTMMKGMSAARGFPEAFANGLANVAALHAAGVPILAGTDANASTGVPVNPAFGASLHAELELLVQAGLSPLDALNAATTLPARHFGLADRGAIAPGLRADLVLLDADPLTDITATRAIRRIWSAGIPVAS
ncbi:amidohydrolase family protein [Nocardia seriolae]|uniref:Enamidase n=2 Tax=Nocardia seriolae TaxID=37332 RepID=A0A0B8NF40_9NOCA|nr:amidohydrolase family protein [Nocardia seriolae]APA96787.1 Enamidase [Nocardia seriolae]MTJ61770.1 amidohydrolase family protein [Nocardia seriolae]MTJ75347.1 amidohydrolase family protein [Nocardia seriolae]MTJ86774.1 amidohydrolase family protein [Nocardia seriolae]MTK30769.1 amidohydrolase family protein [Nocardia seriolae]